MKTLIITLLTLTSLSSAQATGVRCIDGYAYYENADQRPSIIIHHEGEHDNDVLITGVGPYKIKGKGDIITEKDGTPTFIARDLKDRKGNRSTLTINIRGGASPTILKSVFKSFQKNFYCTSFSWSSSEYDRRN